MTTKKLPDLVPDGKLKLPKQAERSLPGGLTVIAIRRTSVPLVELRLEAALNDGLDLRIERGRHIEHNKYDKKHRDNSSLCGFFHCKSGVGFGYWPSGGRVIRWEVLNGTRADLHD